MSIVLHEPDPFECFGVSPPVEAATEVSHTPPLPGSSRRNWVYREIAQLGAEAAPWTHPPELL